MTARISSGSIVWLASYPKSGSTWVRFLLYNLLFGSPESITEVENAIPDIHTALEEVNYASKVDEIVENILCYESILLKTHFKFDVLTDPSFFNLLKSTAGFIYIIRNPLDVLTSNMDYWQLRCAEKINEIGLHDFQTHYVQQFIDEESNRNSRKLGHYGSWDKHVNSWIENSWNIPCLTLRYEDLVNNTSQQVSRVSKFLNLALDSQSIDMAVENSSLAKLRRLAQKENDSKKKTVFDQLSGELACQDDYGSSNTHEVSQETCVLSASHIKEVQVKFREQMIRFEYLQVDDFFPLKSKFESALGPNLSEDVN
ncbi:MAG: sulfotransferase domain-containing protein, partial [Leptolyngbyaceae cyanobacterium]